MILSKAKAFYRDLPIRRKLLLVLYVQIIIPLLFIGYMSYKSSEEIIKKKSTGYSQDILRMIQLRLNDYINSLTGISQDLLYDKSIYNILDKDSLTVDPLVSYEDKGSINSVMKKVILSRSEIQSICFISNKGNWYFYDNNREKVSIKDVLKYEEVLKKAREGEGRTVWYLDTIDGNVENVYLARTVYNVDSFKEIGLMVIFIKKEFLESVYQDLINEDMQNIAVISSGNEQIVSRNPDNTYLLNNSLLNTSLSGNGYIIDNVKGTLLSYVSMRDPDWKIVSYVSLNKLYREIDVLRQRIVLLCILSVLLISVLSIYMAVDFINPIKRIVKGMRKVQEGESSVYVEIDRKDELGYLGGTFNKMAKEINHLVNWIYREQITRKEAELKALQSQINPHFLFNTLESINWMAQLNNVPEISETVTDLSSLMEASIGRDDRLITLEEEVTYADRYISLMKRRFEDRFEWDKSIMPEALKIKIPKLLIQPIIENAVYHGIEKCRGRGLISLKAFIVNGILVIEVMDNGAGISQEELEELNERLSIDNDTYFKTLAEKKKKSIGIDNVNRRIKLFYGEEYGLKIESTAGEYTKVAVTIPLGDRDNLRKTAQVV